MMGKKSKNSVERNVVWYILLFSFIMNLLMAYTIFYKTDIYAKLRYRLGYGENPVIVYKHKTEFRCLQGWTNTLSKLNLDADVVFYGNSLTYESDFRDYFPNLKIVNLGCNMDMLDDLINRVYMIRTVNPKRIFVLGGINYFKETPIDSFYKKYQTLVDSITLQNPKAKVFLQSLLPVNPTIGVGTIYSDCIDKIKNANEIICKIANEKGCEYVDLYSAYQVNDTLPSKFTRDGLHLFPDYYSIWAASIKPYME